MDKVFEDYFTELQTDMVAICLEYAVGKAEKIYIYCSFEDNVISSGFFYRINGKILKKHKINAENHLLDVSTERQKATVAIINEDIEKLIKLCAAYKRDMPTQIKLIYDVNKNSLDADYQYEPIYTNSDTKTAYDVLEEWIKEETSLLLQ